MDWGDLKLLLAVERAGSLAGAARELKVDHTTIGRRIAALEAALGARLLDRRPEGVALTSAGENAAAAAARMEEEALSLERRVGREDERVEGTVRLATTESFATSFLVPRLGDLRARHPGLRLEVAVGVGSTDLLRREADVAVRLRSPAPDAPSQPAAPHLDLVVKKLGSLAHGLYASADYLRRRGRPVTEADLAGHDVVGYGGAAAFMPGAAWLRARTGGSAPFDCVSVSPQTVAAAVGAGMGLGVLPCFVAATRPELVRINPPEVSERTDIWLVVHRDLQRVARIRAVMSTVTDIVQRHAAILDGRGPDAMAGAPGPSPSPRVRRRLPRTRS